MTDAFDDIANAIGRLRQAFKKHHLSPPKAIELGSHRDMDRLRAMLPPQYQFVPQMHDEPVMVAEIAGIEIIAPAQFRARKGGGFDVE